MYSSFTKSTIKNQNTQLTEKSVGITIRMLPDYSFEKSQYPINKTRGPKGPELLTWVNKPKVKLIIWINLTVWNC